MKNLERGSKTMKAGKNRILISEPETPEVKKEKVLNKELKHLHGQTMI